MLNLLKVALMTMEAWADSEPIKIPPPELLLEILFDIVEFSNKTLSVLRNMNPPPPPDDDLLSRITLSMIISSLR